MTFMREAGNAFLRAKYEIITRTRRQWNIA